VTITARMSGPSQDREPGQLPAVLAFDTRTANAARIYDYLLGGKDNFAADRQAGDQLRRISPDAPLAAVDNRAFLGRAVEYLAGDAGITQFLDIGSGLPGTGNVHEVVQAVTPAPRVVYADNDPVVVSHARELAAGKHPLVTAVLGDLRDPESITGHGTVRELIDFRRPVAVTLAAVLHFLGDRDALAAVGHLKDLLVPGSYLVISHATPDGARDGEAEQVIGLYEHTSAPLHLRPLDEVSGFFDGLELVPPGVVPAGDWRSTTLARRVLCYAGAGRKT
jgi:SAM-dependent methyltransferase